VRFGISIDSPAAIQRVRREDRRQILCLATMNRQGAERIRHPEKCYNVQKEELMGAAALLSSSDKKA